MTAFLSSSSEGLFSASVRGRSGPECKHAGSCERDTTATGWIRRHPEGHADRDWYAEFECDEHGHVYALGGRWKDVIARVLADQRDRE